MLSSSLFDLTFIHLSLRPEQANDFLRAGGVSFYESFSILIFEPQLPATISANAVGAFSDYRHFALCCRQLFSFVFFDRLSNLKLLSQIYPILLNMKKCCFLFSLFYSNRENHFPKAVAFLAKPEIAFPKCSTEITCSKFFSPYSLLVAD